MNKTDRKYTKKKLIIALVTIFAVLLVLYIIVSIIPLFEKNQEVEDTEIIADFNFYPADYSEDIFADEEYTELIKNGILQYDNANSVYTILPEDFKDSNEPYAVVCKMLYSVIEGDNEEYNSYFSEKYFETNLPKEKFTAQKIYNATLKLFRVESIQEGKSSYNQYTFTLKYHIYENNGTFRKDIGEGYRTQYFVVTDRSGKMLIDDIQYESYIIK